MERRWVGAVRPIGGSLAFKQKKLAEADAQLAQEVRNLCLSVSLSLSLSLIHSSSLSLIHSCSLLIVAA